MRELAAALVLLAILALFACALIPDPEERKRKKDEAESRRRALERKQRDKAEAMKLDGTHLYKRPFYKPSAAYLAPAKPEVKPVANVRQIRGKR